MPFQTWLDGVLVLNFFESQDRAKKKTGQLVFFFILAVVSLIVMTEGLIIIVFGLFENQIQGVFVGAEELSNPANVNVMVMVALGIIAVVGAACLFKMLQLRSGGAAVAEALNGHLINTNTRDPDEKKRKCCRNEVP